MGLTVQLLAQPLAHEGFHFGPFSAPRVEKRDADLREFRFVEPRLLKRHRLALEKVLQAS